MDASGLNPGDAKKIRQGGKIEELLHPSTTLSEVVLSI